MVEWEENEMKIRKTDCESKGRKCDDTCEFKGCECHKEKGGGKKGG